jgi:hypothetical protein
MSVSENLLLKFESREIINDIGILSQIGHLDHRALRLGLKRTLLFTDPSLIAAAVASKIYFRQPPQQHFDSNRYPKIG